MTPSQIVRVVAVAMMSNTFSVVIGQAEEEWRGEEIVVRRGGWQEDGWQEDGWQQGWWEAHLAVLLFFDPLP